MMKSQPETAAAHVADDLCRHAVRKNNSAPDLRLLGAIDESQPKAAPSGEWFEEQDFQLATARFCAMQPSRENLGVVQDQQIARFKKISQVCEDAVSQLTAPSLEHEETRPLPVPARIGGNQRFRERVIEFLKVHKINAIPAREGALEVFSPRSGRRLRRKEQLELDQRCNVGQVTTSCIILLQKRCEQVDRHGKNGR